MPTVFLNGQPLTGSEAATWGALLDVVDARTAPTGEIVAGVRFDGVDEPGFREEAVLVRCLGSDTIVEIETQTPQALLGGVLEEASSSLGAIEQACRDLAGGFRGIDVEGPARGLGQLAESLMNLVTLVSAAAEAAHVKLDELSVDGQPVAPTIKAIDTALEPLLEASRERDWVTVADILEHDLAPALPRLAPVIAALHEAIAS
jgi:hypothetical protein